MINKTLSQMNSERAARRASCKKPQATSSKPQAPSAMKKPQMIFKTILEFEKDE